MEGQASLSRTDTEKELQMEVSYVDSRYILLYVMGFERYNILPVVYTIPNGFCVQWLELWYLFRR